jgi:hypothetical protein
LQCAQKNSKLNSITALTGEQYVFVKVTNLGIAPKNVQPVPGLRIRIRITVKSWIRIWIRIKNKIQKLFRGSKWSHGGPWTLRMESWRLKMEPWRVYRPAVADSHHFKERLDPDPDPH